MDNVGPILSYITKSNLDGFRNLMPKDFAEEIFEGKSRGIGVLQAGFGNKNVIPVGLVVFHTDPEADDTLVLRIKWLYVHSLFRGKRIGDTLIAEITSLMLREGIEAVTIDIPAGSENTELYKLLEKWHFSFVNGIEPDFMIRLCDITDKEELIDMAEGVHSLSSLKSKGNYMFVSRFFDEQGYQGFLRKVHVGYINDELSCGIKNGTKTALALVHKTPEGVLIVEYVYVPADETGLIVKLISFIIIKALESMDSGTVLKMSQLSYEMAQVLDVFFPRQQTIHLTEGILARL